MILILLLVSSVRSFQNGEPLPVSVTTVRPLQSPNSYQKYYSLPLCAPDSSKNAFPASLGEILVGYKREPSLYNIYFLVDTENRFLCKKDFTQQEVDTLKNAIDNVYVAEITVDGIPALEMIGKGDKDTPFIYTHYVFRLGYREEEVVTVEVSGDEKSLKPLSSGEYSFYYSVYFSPSSVSFSNRLSNALETSKFLKQTHQVRWLSILNCFLFLLFGSLIVLVALKHKIQNNSKTHDIESQSAFMKPDVISPPKYGSVLSALTGAGAQLSVLVCVIGLLLWAELANTGGLTVAAILFYALTSSAGGYVSGSVYRFIGGAMWLENLIYTACAFGGVLFGIWTVLNWAAVSEGSKAALPFATIFMVFLLWVLVTIPLTILGGIYGRNITKPQVYSELPENTKKPSNLDTLSLLVSGFLPYIAIRMQLYYVYSSVWGHNINSLYGVLLVGMLLVFLLTASLSVTFTYLDFKKEEFNWWWKSFVLGGLPAVVMVLDWIYWYTSSEISGTSQNLSFFGYTLLGAWALFLVLGSIGFLSSLQFVKYLFSQLKSD